MSLRCCHGAIWCALLCLSCTQTHGVSLGRASNQRDSDAGRPPSDASADDDDDDDDDHDDDVDSDEGKDAQDDSDDHDDRDQADGAVSDAGPGDSAVGTADDAGLDAGQDSGES